MVDTGNGSGAATLVATDGTPHVRPRLYLTEPPATLLGAVSGVLAARAACLTDVRIGEPSLEDAFIELTGRGLR
jgi:ABC-2 type transport system ATP-binding protein